MGIPTAKRMQSANSSQFAVSARKSVCNLPISHGSYFKPFTHPLSHAPPPPHPCAEQRTLPFFTEMLSHSPAPTPPLSASQRKHQPHFLHLPSQCREDDSSSKGPPGHYFIVLDVSKQPPHFLICPVHKPTIQSLSPGKISPFFTTNSLIEVTNCHHLLLSFPLSDSL